MRWDVNANTLMLSLSILLASWRLASVLRRLVHPFLLRVEEHDVLWEDYALRTGGSFRRRVGRGQSLIRSEDEERKA